MTVALRQSKGNALATGHDVLIVLDSQAVLTRGHEHL